MKRLRSFLSLIFCLLVTCQLSAQVSFGLATKINEDWKFRLANVELKDLNTLSKRGWQNIHLPHDWSVRQQLSPTYASCMGYLPGGIGWYQKILSVPSEKQGEKVFLYFEGVYNRSEVYLNGHLLGKRPNGYISFMYDATPYIKYGEDNIISVKVDHSQDADSRWYTGSGIYRNVWLVYSNPIHIAQWGVYAYPSVANKKKGELSVEVAVDNETDKSAKVTVVNTLYNKANKAVAKSSKTINTGAKAQGVVTATLKVNNPELWDIDNPNLYRLETIVLRDGKQIDAATTTTGFRSFTFDANKGFALNGNWMKVKGVCLHHDAGVLGSAVPREVWERRILTLKEVGVNAIRTSHNPQAPDLYQLCDELGMLVLDEVYDEWEFPKRKWLEGWNVGTPGFEGTFDIFADWSEADMADVVRRDRNHMSVFAWSIGNEVDYPNDPYSHPVLDGGTEGFTQAMFGGYKPDAPDAMRLGAIAKRLVAVVKKYDKSRPTTAGLAGVAMSNETEYPGALDIAGYNYTEGKYAEDHKKYPNRVIYGSENRHELSAWKYTRDNEYIFGQFLWTGIDYLGESGRWPSRGFYSGLLDFGGFIKPRGYFRQSLWSEKPMAYLGTYPTPGKGAKSQLKDVWSQLTAEGEGKNYEEKVPSMDAWSIWNYEEGQMIRVVCYTNTAKAKLELNGAVVGQLQDKNDDHGIIFWDIPYKAGKLEVVALDANNKEVSRYAIETSTRPYALKVVKADQVINKERGFAQVLIEVVDENNVPVILADNMVTCDIAGPATLMGLEASNNSDMTDYTDNQHRVFNGKILAYIEATGQEGDIHVRFTSPLLKEATVTIKAE